MSAHVLLEEFSPSLLLYSSVYSISYIGSRSAVTCGHPLVMPAIEHCWIALASRSEITVGVFCRLSRFYSGCFSISGGLRVVARVTLLQHAISSTCSIEQQ